MESYKANTSISHIESNSLIEPYIILYSLIESYLVLYNLKLPYIVMYSFKLPICLYSLICYYSLEQQYIVALYSAK